MSILFHEYEFFNKNCREIVALEYMLNGLLTFREGHLFFKSYSFSLNVEKLFLYYNSFYSLLQNIYCFSIIIVAVL